MGKDFWKKIANFCDKWREFVGEYGKIDFLGVFSNLVPNQLERRCILVN